MSRHVERDFSSTGRPEDARSNLQQAAATVAICSYGRGPTLVQTIRGLLPEAGRLHVDILVVDQEFEHPDDVRVVLSKMAKEGLIYWLRTSNDSLTGKRNIALHAARGEIILFVDDDVVVPQGFIAGHLNLYGHAHIAGATGQVYHAVDPDNPPPLAQPEIGSIAHFASNSPSGTRSFIGCNHSVRKSAALAIGGYDEQFIGSSQCEDFDFADRLADAGYELRYDPDLWLIHLRAGSGGTRGGSVWPEWTRTANIFMYLFRHGKGFQCLDLLWRALRTGPLRKEIVKNPRSWPGAWLACGKGLVYGWRHRHFYPAPKFSARA